MRRSTIRLLVMLALAGLVAGLWLLVPPVGRVLHRYVYVDLYEPVWPNLAASLVITVGAFIWKGPDLIAEWRRHRASIEDLHRKVDAHGERLAKIQIKQHEHSRALRDLRGESSGPDPV